MKRIKIPRAVGEYIRIYNPATDIYLGADSFSFTHGKRYDEWIANDFSIMRDGDDWHMVGITHPRPKFFTDAYDYAPETVHESETQLFHCVASAGHFSDLMKENSITDCEKILAPDARPGEIPEIYAPHIIKHGNCFRVVYSPSVIRYADSLDFNSWNTGVFFDGGDPSARDPFIFDADGQKRLIYVKNDALLFRECADDMTNWSEPRLLYRCNYQNAVPESPFMIYRDGIYYLTWCIYDGFNSSYDNRCFVFASESFDGFNNAKAPLTILRGHAPEFVFDGDESYMLSVFYPKNGVSAVRLVWE